MVYLFHLSGFFFTPMVVIGCTSVLCSVVILNLHHRGSHRPVPQWLRYFTFRCIAPVLCYRRGPETLYVFNNNGPTRSSTIIESWPRASAHNLRESSVDGPLSPSSAGHGSAEHTRSNGDHTHGETDAIHLNSFCDSSDRRQCCHDRCIREVLKTLEKLHTAHDQSVGEITNNERPVSEWQEVALVLDRFMLLISAMTMLASVTVTTTLFIIHGFKSH